MSTQSQGTGTLHLKPAQVIRWLSKSNRGLNLNIWKVVWSFWNRGHLVPLSVCDRFEFACPSVSDTFKFSLKKLVIYAQPINRQKLYNFDLINFLNKMTRWQTRYFSQSVSVVSSLSFLFSDQKLSLFWGFLFQKWLLFRVAHCHSVTNWQFVWKIVLSTGSFVPLCFQWFTIKEHHWSLKTQM